MRESVAMLITAGQEIRACALTAAPRLRPAPTRNQTRAAAGGLFRHGSVVVRNSLPERQAIGLYVARLELVPAMIVLHHPRLRPVRPCLAGTRRGNPSRAGELILITITISQGRGVLCHMRIALVQRGLAAALRPGDQRGETERRGGRTHSL
jgi:hypothetical protein